MEFDIWLTFALASSALLAIPGPTVLIVVSYALGHGKRSGWATVPGVTLGDLTAMTASLLGAGAVLATSAELFTLLKLVGAAYLVWLGIKLWRAKPVLDDMPGTALEKSAGGMFWSAYVVTALNPKSIVFFVAFVPQFVDPAAPALMQFVVLETTFVTLAAINVAIWAVLAGHLRTRFSKPSTLQLINRTGAAFLISAGLLTAVMRRS